MVCEHCKFEKRCTKIVPAKEGCSLFSYKVDVNVGDKIYLVINHSISEYTLKEKGEEMFTVADEFGIEYYMPSNWLGFFVFTDKQQAMRELTLQKHMK